MSIFNRIVMLLIGLALFLFGGVIFLLLTGLVTPHNSYLRAILALYAAWRAVALLRGAGPSVVLLMALALTIIGLALLIAELVGPARRLFGRSEPKQYVVRQDELGQVTLDRAMVGEVARHVAEATPGVLHADSTMKDRANGLSLALRVSLAWDAEAPAVGELVQERVKEAVQQQLGLPISEVRVTAQSAPVVKEQRRTTHVARVA